MPESNGEKPQLVLKRDEAAKCWTVTYPEGACAEGSQHTIFELFGTYTLPTPFTPLAEAETVLTDVRRRNPTYSVVVAS